jgi:DNA-binding NarL/FixJ family response regulator
MRHHNQEPIGMADLEEAPHSGPNGDKVSVLVIDSRSLTRRWLCEWLAHAVCDLEILPVTSPDDMLSAQQVWRNAHLVVLSIGAARLSDADTLQVIGSLVDRLDRIPMVIVGDREDIDEIIDVVRRGVRGYIPASLDPSEATEAIRFVLGGGTFFPASLLVRSLAHRQDTPERDAADRDALASLTPREMEVLIRLRHGKPNKVIAHELGVSESTVKAFVQRILSKLRAVNRTEVAYLARLHFDSPRAIDQRQHL